MYQNDIIFSFELTIQDKRLEKWVICRNVTHSSDEGVVWSPAGVIKMFSQATSLRVEY